MCPEHLLSWDDGDAQESQGESLPPWAAQPPTISGLQSAPEADQYIDSRTPASVLLPWSSKPWGTKDTPFLCSQGWAVTPSVTPVTPPARLHSDGESSVPTQGHRACDLKDTIPLSLSFFFSDVGYLTETSGSSWPWVVGIHSCSHGWLNELLLYPGYPGHKLQEL